MKTIELDVLLQHRDLVEVFFKTHSLFDIGIVLDIVDTTYTIPINTVINDPETTYRQYESKNTRKMMVCVYDENNKEHIDKITNINTMHRGFNNMLHDFLNKCGLRPNQYKFK